MVGTTDQDKHYHPFAIMLTMNEREEDFEFLFNTLKRNVKEVCQFDYNPYCLVADNAQAISNGCKRVFDISHRVNCWFHVNKAILAELKSISAPVKDKTNHILYKSIKQVITSDIVKFQHLVETYCFEEVYALMIIKWQEKWENDAKVTSFIDYFDQWGGESMRNWYDHFVDFMPITNNALESRNGKLKDTGTFRTQLPLAEFVQLACEGFIHEWSIERRPTLQVLNNKEELETVEHRGQVKFI